MDENRKFLGLMYIAKKPCGKVSAAGWYEEKYAKDIAESIASFIARGDTVETVKRYKGDPKPEFTCLSHEECECRKRKSND